jgi:hypothetical protein
MELPENDNRSIEQIINPYVKLKPGETTSKVYASDNKKAWVMQVASDVKPEEGEVKIGIKQRDFYVIFCAAEMPFIAMCSQAVELYGSYVIDEEFELDIAVWIRESEYSEPELKSFGLKITMSVSAVPSIDDKKTANLLGSLFNGESQMIGVDNSELTGEDEDELLSMYDSDDSALLDRDEDGDGDGDGDESKDRDHRPGYDDDPF